MNDQFDADRHAFEHARFADDDAAYVLGALDAGQRADFERHLEGCPLCQAQVAELAALPAALAVADPAGWPTEPPPASLLPRLLWQVSAQRRRRRLRTAALGAVAACLISLLSIAGLSAWHSSQRPAILSFRPVTAAAGSVRATAELTATSSGTLLHVTCGHYQGGTDSGTGYRNPQPGEVAAYRLVVINRDGARQVPTSWSPDRDIVLDTSTNWQQRSIGALEIEDSSGAPILRLEL